MDNELIGNKAIEIHFRTNPNFVGYITEFIPVWEGQSIEPPDGYSWIECPEVGGRLGDFVK